MPRSLSPNTALWLVFFVNGAVLSSWAPRVPAVAGALGLADDQLGIALFGVAAGSVPALLVTGRLLRRGWPAATLCRVSGALFAATLPGIALAGSLLVLTLALVVAGAASGALDVAMNTATVRYEREIAPRRILARLHGGYSLGVLAGASGATVAAATGIPVLPHFAAVSVGLLVLLARAAASLPADTPEPAATRPTRLPPVALLVLAVGALFLEGTVTHWSALLVTRDLGGSATLGAASVTLFTVAMSVARTWGDQVAARRGARTVAAAGAVLAGVALPLGAAQPDPVLVLAAVACAGLGLGPLFPAAVGAVGRAGTGEVGTATAAVTAVGYLAYLAGPPLVGFVSQAVGLPTTLAAAAVTTATALVLAARSGFR